MAKSAAPRHLPSYEFIRRMSRSNKIVLLLMLGGLLVYGILFTLAAENPVRWSLTVNENISGERVPIPIQTAEANYRSMTAEIGAWVESVSYSATPILPTKGMLILFAIAMSVGWGFLLSAATTLKSFFSYIIYFALALFLFSSQFQQAIFPAQSWIAPALIMLLMLGPAFLCQQEIINPPLWMRGLWFSLVLGSAYLISYLVKGVPGLHAASVEVFFVLFFVTCFFLFQLGTAPVNLLLLLSTNAKKPSLRLPLPIVSALFLILIAVEFIMMQETFHWNLIEVEDFPLRPAHFIAAFAFIAVFTSQNAWISIKEFISNAAWSQGFAALALITLGSVFYFTATGEYLFLYIIERIAAVFFFSCSLLYFVYILVNFSGRFAKKHSFYYYTMLPQSLIYAFVVVASVLLSITLAASSGFKEKAYFQACQINRRADQDFLSGKFKDASENYRTSNLLIDRDVKSNYNHGWLIYEELGQKFTIANQFYDHCDDFFSFPYGALNKGTLEKIYGRIDEARKTYSKFLESEFDYRVANNLALSWLMLGKPDSAIVRLKQAIQVSPSSGALQTNLGRIYLRFGYKEYARKFFESAMKSSNPGPASFANAMFYNLYANDSLPVDTVGLHRAEIWRETAPISNYALWLFRENKFASARTLVDTLLARNEPPDAMMLDGALKMESGLYEHGVSRLKYLAKVHEDYAPEAMRWLAFCFFKKNVPEVAAHYFKNAQEKGGAIDVLNEARMELDAGNPDYAFDQFNLAREANKNFIPDVAKENALLQYSRGLKEEALNSWNEITSTEMTMKPASISIWNFPGITKEEIARTGVYAAQIGDRTEALSIFGEFASREKTSIIPYIEMGKLSNRMRDTLVLYNIKRGLELQPDNIELNCEWLRGCMMVGDERGAKSTLTKIMVSADGTPEVMLVHAEYSLYYEEDTAKAISTLEDLVKQEPLFQRGIIALAKLYHRKQMWTEGQQLITVAMRLNERNPDFWYYLAKFEIEMGRYDEAATDATKAIELLVSDPERGRRIGHEFEDAIKNLFINQQP